MPQPLSRRSFLTAALLSAGAAACAPQLKQPAEKAATPPPSAPTTPPTPTPSVAEVQETGASSRMPRPEDYDGAAPTHFGLSMPGIVETVPTVPGARTIALTFDACGGAYDHALIDVLREHEVPATLFLAQPWIEAHPEITRELVRDELFQIENHGTRHLPLSVTGASAYGIHGTASPEEAIAEIAGNAEVLRGFGVESRWFRSGTAHYDDVAVRIARDGGVRIAGFAVNGDYGAQAGAHAVTSQIVSTPDGGIVLAHMNHPGSGTAAGVRHAVEQLQGTGVRFVTLAGAGAST